MVIKLTEQEQCELTTEVISAVQDYLLSKGKCGGTAVIYDMVDHKESTFRTIDIDTPIATGYVICATYRGFGNIFILDIGEKNLHRLQKTFPDMFIFLYSSVIKIGV